MTQEYYGTKKVTAWREDIENIEKGEKLKKGYAVKYKDGYISWSPKEVFEEAYQPINALSFGHAMVAMERGHILARAIWGDVAFIQLQRPGVTSKMTLPYMYITTVNPKTKHQHKVPWLPAHAELLCNDWRIIK